MTDKPLREPWPSVVGWPYSCDKCGEKGECFTGCGLAECDAVAIRESRPTPPQDAEAVSRPDLTAETLAYLEFQAADKLRVDANRTAMGMVPTDAWRKDAAMYAHAAACVREVAALRARPALPADVQAATKWLSGQVEQGWMDITESHDREEWAHISALLAHLKRQADTP